jgi:hypothetical protein
MTPLFQSGNYVCLGPSWWIVLDHNLYCHTVGSGVKSDILEEHAASIFRVIEFGLGGYWVIVRLGYITTDGQLGQTILRACDQMVM